MINPIKQTGGKIRLLYDILLENLKNAGYSFLNIQEKEIDQLQFSICYRVLKNQCYFLLVTNENSGYDYTSENYYQVIRFAKKVIYSTEVNDIKFLTIFITGNPGDMSGLITSDYWVIDKREYRLMIYENQISEFLDVKKIINITLEGNDIKKPGSGKLKKENIPICTIILIAINFVIYFYTELTGSPMDPDYMIKMGAGYWPDIVYNHEYYRIITHFFLHFSIDHLFNNMISLLALGITMEKFLGRWKFISLYFASGIVAGTASIAYNMIQDQYVVSAGASGAIYGLMGAVVTIMLIGRKRGRRIQLNSFLLFLVLSLYSGFHDTGIDNIAHLSGLIFGFILMGLYLKFFYKKGRVYKV